MYKDCELVQAPHTVRPQSTQAAARAVCTARGGPTPAVLVDDETAVDAVLATAADARLDAWLATLLTMALSTLIAQGLPSLPLGLSTTGHYGFVAFSLGRISTTVPSSGHSGISSTSRISPCHSVGHSCP